MILNDPNFFVGKQLNSVCFQPELKNISIEKGLANSRKNSFSNGEDCPERV